MATTAKAPLTILVGLPLASITAASDIFPRLVGAQNIHPGRFVERRERVGKTPRRATARAPTVAASVHIDGRATGIEATSRRADAVKGRRDFRASSVG
jgi:hypothetical protein